MMNAAAGIFLAARRGPALPYDAEVECLESTGTQWINTGVVISMSTVWITDCIYKGNGAEGVNGYGYFFAGGSGGNIYAGIYEAVLRTNLTIGTRHVIKLDSTSGLYVDGELKVAKKIANTGENIFHLFNTSRSGNSSTYYIRKKDYGDKIWVNGILVRDFIPVRFTNESGQSEGAMYDRVSGQLFRNSGTGAFTIGPDKTA